jgi:uncharacterized protein
MEASSSVTEKLSGVDCLRLMASVPVGRVIYTRQALPAVELVNFAVEGGDIVIRTSPGGKLAAAARDAIVAFETDRVDTARRSGWSVTAIGRSQEVTDPADIGRLRQIGLESWAPGERDHFIRITPGILNGVRLQSQQRHSGGRASARR